MDDKDKPDNSDSEPSDNGGATSRIPLSEPILKIDESHRNLDIPFEESEAED